MTKDKHRLLRRDLYLICMLLAIAIVGIFVLSLQTDGDHVSVSIAGEHYGEFPLNKNGEWILKTGKNNENLNVLVIHEGKAFVANANCPDGICVNHRAISKNGESIICLPHQIVITVCRKSQTNIDIVV